MNSKQFIACATILSGALAAQAAGFALYGGSTKGMALGGAVMGRAVDASANFYNPATLTDFTNTVITLGGCMEVPRANVQVHHEGSRFSGKLNSGAFYLPHFYIAQPLPWDFTFGLGCAPEFGIGSAYRNSWPMNWNTIETTVEGFTINPNLAYKVTEDWSVSGGLRFIFIDFEQYSRPYAAKDGVKFGQMQTHLEGDNNFSGFGWQVSTKYDILDNLHFGLMYKSEAEARVRGHYRTKVRSYDYSAAPGLVSQNLQSIVNQMLPGVVGQQLTGMGIMPGHPAYETYYEQVAAVARPQIVAQARPKVESEVYKGIKNQVDAGARHARGHAAADVTLPQSVIAGLDWEATETVRFGTAVTWTHWSSMDKLAFKLQGGDRTVPLKWDDVFRFSFAGAWDFSENWTLMGSYIYDMDPCSTRKNVGSTMLPAGDRHLMTMGLAWHWGNWEIAGCYGLILMDGRPQKYSDELGREYRFTTSAGRSHQLGLSLSYYF